MVRCVPDGVIALVARLARLGSHCQRESHFRLSCSSTCEVELKLLLAYSKSNELAQD
jgi:hypothetical protein